MYVEVGVGWNVGTCQKQSGAGEEHKRSSHLSSASNEDLDEEELVKLPGRLVTQIFRFLARSKIPYFNVSIQNSLTRWNYCNAC